MRKTLSVLLIALLSVLIAASAFASSAPWDGVTKTEVKPFRDTDESVVYWIRTGAELAWVADQVNTGSNDFSGKHVKLKNDIDLGNKEWPPIGVLPIKYVKDGDYYSPEIDDVNAKPFKGSFNGRNYSIINLKISAKDDMHAQGLFSHTVAKVKNLKVKGNVEGLYYVGGICGVSSAEFQNVESNVNVSGVMFVGGITGIELNDQIRDCISANNTLSGSVNVGGIAGKNFDITRNCYSNSKITGITTSQPKDNPIDEKLTGYKLGGIVGDNAGVVENCTFTGRITGDSNLGGIAGRNNNNKDVNVIVQRSISDAKVESTTGDDCVGGITGMNRKKNELTTTYVTRVTFCGWNSSKTVKAIGKEEGNVLSSNIKEFTNIATLKPATVFLNTWRGGLPIDGQVNLAVVPSNSSMSLAGANFEWKCISYSVEGKEVSKDCVELVSGQGTASVVLKAVNKPEFDQNFSVVATVSNLYGDTMSEVNLTYTGWINPPSAPEPTPITPVKSQVECGLDIQSVSDTSTIPVAVQELVEKNLTTKQVLPKASAVKTIVEKDGSLSAVIDTTVSIKPLPVFSGDITTSGNTMLATVITQLDEYEGKSIDGVAVLKILKDASMLKFNLQKTPENLVDGEFAITHEDGTVLMDDEKLVKGTKYAVTMAVKDGGKYDLDGIEDGSVLDPAVLAVTKAAPAAGSSGGCSTGAGLISTLLFIPAAMAFRRRKR